jgi:hypothetical protein
MHGGTLVQLVAEPERAQVLLSNPWNGHPGKLTRRQLCDLELLRSSGRLDDSYS